MARAALATAGQVNTVAVTFPREGTYYICYSVEGQVYFSQALAPLSVVWGMYSVLCAQSPQRFLLTTIRIRQGDWQAHAANM